MVWEARLFALVILFKMTRTVHRTVLQELYYLEWAKGLAKSLWTPHIQHTLWTVTVWSTLQSSEHQNDQTQKQFLSPSNPSHEHLTLNVEHTRLLYIIYSPHIHIFPFQICTYQICTHECLYFILCHFVHYLYICILFFCCLCPVLLLSFCCTVELLSL